MATMNDTLSSGAIDSADVVFRTVRHIVPYIDACIKDIESRKPGEECKGAALQTHNAYKKGLLEAYNDLKKKIIKCGFPGTGGSVIAGEV